MDQLTQQAYRAIAFTHAADGLATIPWLSTTLKDAPTQIEQQVLDKGVSLDDWKEVQHLALQSVETPRDERDALQGAIASWDKTDSNSDSNSSTDSTQAELDEEVAAILAQIYGARVGWEHRLGEMPPLDARHPAKMAAFLKANRTIESDDGLSERADQLYQRLTERGVEPDETFAQTVQAQYDQFHATIEADTLDDPLDLMAAIESAVIQTRADVVELQSNPMVERTAHAALNWLFLIGSNHYHSEHNQIDWNPDQQTLTIEGEVSLQAQRQGQQWHDLGSERLSPAFAQAIEDHLQHIEDLSTNTSTIER